jgi:catechol 2,3-dioxygenase
MAVATETDHAGSIAEGTAIGSVQLTVGSRERSQAFYERLLGLTATEHEDGSLAFAPAGGPDLFQLVIDERAQPRDPRQTGLFHTAILLPERRDLAVALVRLAQGGWRISGASDHLVSEALYLNDPDGNGIEIYHDRDRRQWRFDANGQPEMATLALDIDDLLSELDKAPADPEIDSQMPSATRIGHVHLQVAELSEIERFYTGVLGLDVTVRTYQGALFVSAGGYHHHIGLNTWNSRGGSAPAPGSVGLRSYELKLGDRAALDAVLTRVSAAEIPVESDYDGTALVRDPSANAIRLTV